MQTLQTQSVLTQKIYLTYLLKRIYSRGNELIREYKNNHPLPHQPPTFLSIRLPFLLGLNVILNTLLTSFGIMKMGSLF